MKKDAVSRAAQTRLLCLDVDGTLTDGNLFMRDGKIGRAFNVLDGLGVQMFVRAGGVAAIITAASEAEGGDDIRARAAQMGVTHIRMGATDKRADMRELMGLEGVEERQTAFMGDDLPDLTAMQAAGFAAAPSTAAAPIVATAHYIAALPAGGGAVRDVCEFILAAKAGAAGSAA